MLTKADLLAIKNLISEKYDDLKQELINRITTSEDKVMGRLDKIDQELALLTGDKDQLEEHEERLNETPRGKPRGIFCHSER